MREIKFRMWTGSVMLYDVSNVYECLKQQKGFDAGYIMGKSNPIGVIPYNHIGDDSLFLQFTGHKDVVRKDIYEGDILRTTIEESFGDVNHYFIVTWIKEWAMFAALFHSEYPGYLKKGAEALDESMFWTFTIESDNTFTVCGNIYEHPDYIKKCMEAAEDQRMNEEL